jgi:hypothetical protein
LTSLALPVSVSVKRVLTGLQIAQFVGGCFIACSYIFIEYDAMAHLSTDYVGGAASKFNEDNGISSHARTRCSAQEESGIISNLEKVGDAFEVRRISCLENSGQAFALWLTTLYCVPLIYLFVCFSNRSYLKGVRSHSK